MLCGTEIKKKKKTFYKIKRHLTVHNTMSRTDRGDRGGGDRGDRERRSVFGKAPRSNINCLIFPKILLCMKIIYLILILPCIYIVICFKFCSAFSLSP